MGSCCMLGAVERSQVKLSSLVGKEALVQNFRDVSLAETSAADLWAKVRCTACSFATSSASATGVGDSCSCNLY